MTMPLRFPSADLESFPDDGKRYEIIDGELYVSWIPSSAPSARLQPDSLEASVIVHDRAIEDSKVQPVPAIVLAYQNVYDTFPHGWPPWEFDKRRD